MNRKEYKELKKELEANQDWKERFKKTKFAKGGGSSFECSDYEGMCSDLLDFISQELKAQTKRILDVWIRCGGKCLCCDLAEKAILIIREETSKSI